MLARILPFEFTAGKTSTAQFIGYAPIRAFDIPTLASGDVTLEASFDGGGTWRDVHDASGEVKIVSTGTGACVLAAPAAVQTLIGCHVRLTASVDQTAVIQALTHEIG